VSKKFKPNHLAFYNTIYRVLFQEIMKEKCGFSLITESGKTLKNNQARAKFSRSHNNIFAL